MNLVHVGILFALIAAVIRLKGGEGGQCSPSPKVSVLPLPPMFKQVDLMSKNQEATLKISNHTLHEMKIMKAEGNFKNYDSLIHHLIQMVNKT